MRTLKALHFVKEGDEYQVIGVYRNAHHSRIDNEPEYATTVLDHGTDYYCVRASLKKLAQANNVEPFDFVSVPLIESMAKMEKGQ